MTTTKTPFQMQPGDRVQGAYYGAPFTGTVTEARPHTCNVALMLLYVDLDAPITVFGTTRDTLGMHVREDGTHSIPITRPYWVRSL